MELYKKITIGQKAEQLNSTTAMEAKDIESIWDAMAEDEETVTLSRNYGETIAIREKNGDGVRILNHTGENTKFQHIYSLVE